MAKNEFIIFSGNANLVLAERIAQSLSMHLGESTVGRFSDGEIQVEIKESVRGMDIYVVQPTCTPDPAGNLMEMLVIIDALKRASAKRITAVVPYYGFARQDRRVNSARVPITAKLTANMIAAAGADRVLTVDLHSDQIQGFFDIPVDNVYASPLFIQDIRASGRPVRVVSPDVGGVVRARAIAKQLDAELAIIDKRRPQANVAEVMNIIGDVDGQHCILIDDMVDTAGTLCKAAAALKERGALSVRAYATHAVLSGPAIKNINDSVIDELVVSDTIPLSLAAQECEKVRQLSIAPLLGETIRRVHEEESVSSMMASFVSPKNQV